MEEALLTNRELAALIVLGGLIAFALVRPGRHKNLRSFGALVSLGKPSILVPLVLYRGWTFAAAAGAARLGQWNSALLKTAILWLELSGSPW